MEFGQTPLGRLRLSNLQQDHVFARVADVASGIDLLLLHRQMMHALVIVDDKCCLRLQ